MIALLALSAALGGLWLQPTLAALPAQPDAAPTVILAGDAPTPTPTPTPTADAGDVQGRISQLAWSPDGATLTVAAANGIFHYDGASFALVRSISSNSLVTSGAYSPDGTLLGVGTVAGEVRCWRVAETEPFLTIKEQVGPVNSVAFSNDGAILAAGYWDGVVRLWRCADGALAGVLEGHVGQITSVAFTRDGTLLASGSADGTVRLWQQPGAGAAVRAIKVGSSPVNSVAFSVDGAVLAAASGDGVVRLFRVRDGALLRTLQGHTSLVNDADFSPDGAWLASASADGTVRLWRASDGASLRVLSAEIGPLASLTFSPDGGWLAAGSLDGQVKVWDLRGLVLAPASTPTGRPLVVVTEEPPGPTTTPVSPGCADDAEFVGDVTVPDDTILNAGERFDKVWRIRNRGTCTWGAGYRMIFTTGEIMGAQNNVGVLLTGPGATTDVSIAMQAPATPGQYTGWWQMANAAGHVFGPQFTAIIRVLAEGASGEGSAGTPTATNTVPPPPPGAHMAIYADRTTINGLECTNVRADVEGVAAAWLEGEPIVGGHAVKNVCPCADTMYTLRVVLIDGTEMERTVTITVVGSCTPTATATRFMRTLPLIVTVTPTSRFMRTLPLITRTPTATPTSRFRRMLPLIPTATTHP